MKDEFYELDKLNCKFDELDKLNCKFDELDKLNFFFFDSVQCPFQDYFTHRDEPIDRWGETGVPRKNHLTHPQAELGLSHMWPVRGSNLHQTQPVR